MKRLTFLSLGPFVPTGISIQEMPTAGRGHSARSRGRPKGSGSTAKGAGKGRSRKSTAGSAAAMAGAKAGAAAASAAAYAAYGYNVSKGTEALQGCRLYSGQLSWVWGGSLKSQPESQTYSAGRALSLLGIQHLSQDVLGQ